MRLNRALLHGPNFQKLLLIVGDRQKAIGILSELFILAQDYFLPDKHPIPQAELIDAEIPIETMIRLKFLVKEVEGYYLRNSEETFAYYYAYAFNEPWFKKMAGEKSAKSPKHHSKRDESGRFIPKEQIDELQKTKKRDVTGNPKPKRTAKKAKKKVTKVAKKAKKKTVRKKTKKKATKKVAKR